MNIEKLYEDDNLLVVIKPNTIATEGDRMGRETLVSILEKEYPSLHVITRLDQNVGGIVVLAKTKEAASKLSLDIQNHNNFEKFYYCIVEGTPDEEGTFEDYLYQDTRAHKSIVVSKSTLGGKLARLHYRKVKQMEGYALLDVELQTGRFHQIRCQMAHHKMPILADKKYGSKANGNIALFSYKVRFCNPKNNQIIQIESKPKDEIFSRWFS